METKLYTKLSGSEVRSKSEDRSRKSEVGRPKAKSPLWNSVAPLWNSPDKSGQVVLVLRNHVDTEEHEVTQSTKN